MIKSGSHMEKMLKQLALKDKLSTEDYLLKLLNDEYKIVFKKSYLL